MSTLVIVRELQDVPLLCLQDTPSLTLPGLAPTPGRISGPSERREAILGGDRPAGGPEKEAAQRQGSLSLQPPPIAIRIAIIRHSRFLDVARSRSDARPDFRSGRASERDRA
eukprot:3289017-Pyramimonas_sp.AAC.1